MQARYLRAGDRIVDARGFSDRVLTHRNLGTVVICLMEDGWRRHYTARFAPELVLPIIPKAAAR